MADRCERADAARFRYHQSRAADEHKCLAEAMRDIKLPKYEKWANYDAYLPMNIERYCDFYSLGI